jgi:hypothetical protein
VELLHPGLLDDTITSADEAISSPDEERLKRTSAYAGLSNGGVGYVGHHHQSDLPEMCESYLAAAKVIQTVS